MLDETMAPDLNDANAFDHIASMRDMLCRRQPADAIRIPQQASASRPRLQP